MEPQTATSKVDEAKEIQDFYSTRPSMFLEDALKANPWHLQKEITEAVFKYPVVAVKSCNASGKSFIAARIALAYLSLKPGSIVITTAPTWRQVKDVLWREIRTALSLTSFKLTKQQATQVGLDIADDWFAVGLSTKDAEKFFGYHADDILVIVDEASGVEEEIWIGVDAVTPNLNAHVLAIGNPTNPDGRFYKMFQDPLVKTFTISAFDTPNLTANGIRNIDELVNLFTAPADVDALDHIIKVQSTLKMPYPALQSPINVYRKFLQWGTDHPMWQALIMGEFPSQSTLSLIPLNLIIKSQEVWKQMNAAKTDPELAEKVEWGVETTEAARYGLDVARFGDDSTVLTPARGGYIEKQILWSKADTAITTERVIKEVDTYDHRTIIKVDDIGVGGGVTDQLIKELRDHVDYQYRVEPINVGAGTSNPLKYYNLRAELYDYLAQMFKDRKIAIPDDDELAGELAAIRIAYVGKNNDIMQVEGKQKIKQRLGKSPDRADSLMLAAAKSQFGQWEPVKPNEEEPTNSIASNTVTARSYRGESPITSRLRRR